MRQMLEKKLARFEELERQLADPEVLTAPERMAAVAREHGSLGKLATKYRRFREVNQQIREATEMVAGGRLGTSRVGRGRVARAEERARGNLARAFGYDHWR